MRARRADARATLLLAARVRLMPLLPIFDYFAADCFHFIAATLLIIATLMPQMPTFSIRHFH
jgi:hypothetical protein